RLKNIQFWQQRLELRQEGKWFVRGYLTSEDAGDTYDIYTTALRLQEASGGTREWNTAYFNLWDSWIGSALNPGLLDATVPEYLTPSEALAQGVISSAVEYDAYIQQFVAAHQDLYVLLHQMVADSVNKMDNAFLDPAFLPGTDRFDQKFNEIIGKRFTEGGSLFYDRSRLAHAMGEYRFKPGFGEVVVGGNFRQYMPNSAGTIFKDTANVKIRNREFGVFAGLEKKFMEDKLKATATL